MPSTIAANRSPRVLQVRSQKCKAGDTSYELPSVKSVNDSISVGSAASADSFVYIIGDDDESDDLEDPYLSRRRRRTTKNPPIISPVRTPVTTPMDDSIIDDGSVSSRSLQGLPQFLEIPIKSFETSQEDVTRRREAYSPLARKSLHERNYWNKIVSDRIQHYGTIHLRVGEGLLLLGNAHMNCKEYSEALKVYKSAVRIFRKIYGDSHLTVARSLDKVGLCSCRENPTIALVALKDAFNIRYESLGPIHVDTVDSLNNMAGVHLRMRDYHLARKAYHEVYMVRQIIFGPRHASVAITAHALGGVHLKLAQVEDAARYYKRAMEIYKKLRLKAENPVMKRLLRDIAALERVSTAVFGIVH